MDSFSSNTSSFASLITTIFLCIYSLYSANRTPIIKHFTIDAPSLTKDNFTILHLSDIHIGPMTRKKEISNILNDTELFEENKAKAFVKNVLTPYFQHLTDRGYAP